MTDAAEQRCRNQWAHTSLICAVVANSQGADLSPSDFDPFAVDSVLPTNPRSGLRIFAKMMNAKGLD